MFTVRVPLIPILAAVAHHCHLNYLSTIRETLEDGTRLYGIELELPTLFVSDAARVIYFWAQNSESPEACYEDAAEQALIFLQELYGFVVHDFNHRSATLHVRLLQSLFRLANRGARLARLVISGSEHGFVPPPELIACAEDLLYDMENI